VLHRGRSAGWRGGPRGWSAGAPFRQERGHYDNRQRARHGCEE
jgi:hypothetical protein